MAEVSYDIVKQGLECCQLRACKDGYLKRCSECYYGIGLCEEDRLHQDALELLDEIQAQNQALQNSMTKVVDVTLQSLHEVEIALSDILSAPEERTALHNSFSIIEEAIAKIKNMESDTIHPGIRCSGSNRRIE